MATGNEDTVAKASKTLNEQCKSYVDTFCCLSQKPVPLEITNFCACSVDDDKFQMSTDDVTGIFIIATCIGLVSSSPPLHASPLPTPPSFIKK